MNLDQQQSSILEHIPTSLKFFSFQTSINDHDRQDVASFGLIQLMTLTDAAFAQIKEAPESKILQELIDVLIAQKLHWYFAFQNNKILNGKCLEWEQLPSYKC